MSLKGKSSGRAAVLAAVVASVLFCSRCGDVYRPVANPVFQPGGDPQRTRHALVVSANGCMAPAPQGLTSTNNPAPGTAMVIDVSGDSHVGTFTVGRCPVHAVAPTGTDYVVNRDDYSVSAFTLAGIGNPPSIISLPSGASPVFAAFAQNKLFVAESALAEVADISAPTNSLTTQIPVGNDPVALVATPDGTQLYSINQGSNDVTVIFPGTDQVLAVPIPVGASPVWGTVSADGSRVFVVNQGTSSVTLIDTASDTVIGTLPVGAGPNYIVYESTLNRAYVTNPAGNSLSIIDNNAGTVLPPISLAGPPCNGQHPISVTALADGSRVYVADRDGNSVCVLNTTSNTFTKRICLVQDPGNAAAPCVGSATPVFIASDSDPTNPTRVYTANQFQTAPFAIASISRQNITNLMTQVVTGVVTVTTNLSNPFVAGQPLTIAGVSDSSYDGTFGITSVISSTQFTYVQNGLPNSSFVNTGTAAVLPYVSLIQTSQDSLVLNSGEATDNASLHLTTPPLTIPAGGTPTFIVMTP